MHLSGGDGNHVKIVAGDGDLVLVSSALNNATFLHRDAPSELLPNEVTDLQDGVLASGTISDVVVDGKMGINELHLVLRKETMSETFNKKKDRSKIEHSEDKNSLGAV